MAAPSAETHLFVRVARDIERSITAGALRTGDRLPSLRQAQHLHGISLTTALRAYVDLEARGVIEARSRSGFFVAGPRRVTAPPRASAKAFGPRLFTAAASAAEVIAASLDPSLVPLGASTLSAEWLPTKQLTRITRSLLATELDRTLNYSPSEGDLELRRQIARRSALWGAPVEQDEVIVTSGCTEALSLALRAMAPPGSPVVIESPTHFGFLQMAREFGHPVLALPTDPERGLEPEALRRALSQHAIGACLLAPNFHNPLGALMPEARKEEIVALTNRFGVPLIEDDIYGELAFGEERPPLMRRYDRKGLVTSCSSVSKALAPGYRVGWCLPGARFSDSVRRLKIVTSMASPTLEQKVVARFLDGGAFDRHLRKLRERLRIASHAMTSALLRHLPPSCRFVPPRGANMFWVELPPTVRSAELYSQARDAGISIVPGDLFAPQSCFGHHVRLTCTRPFDTRSEAAIMTLGELIRADR